MPKQHWQETGQEGGEKSWQGHRVVVFCGQIQAIVVPLSLRHHQTYPLHLRKIGQRAGKTKWKAVLDSDCRLASASRRFTRIPDISMPMDDLFSFHWSRGRFNVFNIFTLDDGHPFLQANSPSSLIDMYQNRQCQVSRRYSIKHWWWYSLDDHSLTQMTRLLMTIWRQVRYTPLYNLPCMMTANGEDYKIQSWLDKSSSATLFKPADPWSNAWKASKKVTRF